MPRARLLHIEDDPKHVQLVQDFLRQNDWQVEAAYTGEEGLAKAREMVPDVIILDLYLPERAGDAQPSVEAGVNLLRRIKDDPLLKEIPLVIFSIAAQHVDLRILARRLGADEFLGKSDVQLRTTDITELEAAIQNILGRPSFVLPAHGVAYDPRTNTVYRDGQPLEERLTRLEARLLQFLQDHRGKVCSRDEVIAAVYPDASPDSVTDQQLDRLVSRLREKIEPDRAHPRYLLTERGHGWRLV
ncbi:MAG: response regulator transcription factor [Chloroflexia bacterium]